jgi:hypothetical protein
MARFRLRTVLIVTAVVALWLSTVTEYPSAEDVRRSLLLLIYLTTVVAAIHYRGRQRAFYMGFCTIFFVIYFLPRDEIASFITPRFNWLPSVTTHYGFGPQGATNDFYLFIQDTVFGLWMLLLSTVLGFVSAHIYDQSRKPNDS